MELRSPVERPRCSRSQVFKVQAAVDDLMTDQEDDEPVEPVVMGRSTVEVGITYRGKRTWIQSHGLHER